MPLEDFIISVFCCVEELLKEVVGCGRLRSRGFAPKLSDGEVITLEIVGEFLGLNHDKAIWTYFKRHWGEWFPRLGSRTTFLRQAANTWHVKQQLQQHLAKASGAVTDPLHLIDGFPLPVCHFRRAHFSRLFKGHASYGYCASKAETYYGFKGHLPTRGHGVISGFTLTPAPLDERDAVFDVIGTTTGLLLGDKGYIRPLLQEELRARHLDLQTPLRSNMTDTRTPDQLQRLTAQRRLIETVIGQLQDRFQIAASGARDLWHLTSRITRKLLAHTVAACLNYQLNTTYLNLDTLVTV
jgi:hypothetical protein